MKPMNHQAGFTPVELVVVLAISGMILGVLSGIFIGMTRIPVKVLGELEAAHEIRKAVLVLTEDGNVARSFTPGSEPDYGTFSWFELSGDTPVPVTVRYYWDGQAVLRLLDRGGEVSEPAVVLEPVLQYSDVVFQYIPPDWEYDAATRNWSYTEGKMTVAVKVTEERGSVFTPAIATATLTVHLRPQPDRPVALPGRTPPQPPPPNQVDFLVSGNPTLLQGSYRSGSGQDLRFDDSSYYVVRGSGSPRTVIWEATSEVIDYTNITEVQIEFIGQSNTAGVLQELFVFNPTDPAHSDGGYATSPDHAEPYPFSGTDKKMLFYLDLADIAYLNSLSTKVIKLKVKASASSPFDLSGDRLIFRVAGTPAATFFQDYVVEETPTIEVGSYVSGNVASLASDDTDYYSVRQSGSTLQWVTVSQPISLDSVSSVEVRFIARATKTGAVQSIFVFNPAHGGDGYAATADHQFTYDAANADRTVSFLLAAEDVSYVSSLFPKEVRLRIKATYSSLFDLDADQLIFRVKP